MNAVRYQAPGDFGVADMSMPPVGPLDVRIKIHQSGVYGTVCTCRCHDSPWKRTAIN